MTNSRLQVKHLLRPQHTIVFHVDASAGSDYLVRELELLCAGHENMHVLPTRFDTTWGGSGLMQMYLAAITFALSFQWDHFINLSEQDFPLVTAEKLQAFLAPKLGKNFLNAKLEKTAKERARLISKQGLKFVCAYFDLFWVLFFRQLLKGFLVFLFIGSFGGGNGGL